MFFASVYEVAEDRWAVALRLHTSACDRTSAVALLREMMGNEMRGEEGGGGEASLGIEDYIPKGKAHKPLWARGVDMLGYSLNSFRLGNLDFEDVESPRCSQFVRLKINADDTERILNVSCIIYLIIYFDNSLALRLI